MKRISLDMELLHLFSGHFLSCLIVILIQSRCNLQSCSCGRMTDQFQDDLVGGQGFGPPVDRDKGEHRMLNVVPFGGTRRIVADMDSQPCASGKLLQALLPELVFIAVTAAAISKQEDLRCLCILLAGGTGPPAGQRSDGKFRRVGIDANIDEPLFFQDIVDAIGDVFGARPSLRLNDRRNINF